MNSTPLACALALTAASAHAQNTSPVILASTGPTKLYARFEALNQDVVRVWYSTTPTFSRQPSLALQTAPKTRVPLSLSRHVKTFELRTKDLILAVDPQTLAFSVTDAKSEAPIVAPTQLRAPAPNGSWTLIQRLAPDEHLLGLGQDNRNQGKFDRRGTIRTLWAGQQIRSGDVTADYPIPFMLSTGP